MNNFTDFEIYIIISNIICLVAISFYIWNFYRMKNGYVEYINELVSMIQNYKNIDEAKSEIIATLQNIKSEQEGIIESQNNVIVKQTTIINSYEEKIPNLNDRVNDWAKEKEIKGETK